MSTERGCHHGRSKKAIWTLLSWAGEVFVITSSLLLKLFSQFTFTILLICFVNVKGYFDWQKPSHVTFSPRFFCLLFLYYKVFSQLKNKHYNMNIEVSFSCPKVVKFYKCLSRKQSVKDHRRRLITSYRTS